MSSISASTLPAFVDPQVLWGVLEAFVCVSVYLIHVLVVVVFQTLLLEISMPALAKFAIVSALGLVISFGLIALIRRISGVARVV